MHKQNSTGSSSGSSETRKLMEIQTVGRGCVLRFGDGTRALKNSEPPVLYSNNLVLVLHVLKVGVRLNPEVMD